MYPSMGGNDGYSWRQMPARIINGRDTPACVNRADAATSRREARCAENPQKCEEMKARMQERCAQNPECCDKMKTHMKDRKGQ